MLVLELRALVIPSRSLLGAGGRTRPDDQPVDTGYSASSILPGFCRMYTVDAWPDAEKVPIRMR